MRHLVAALTSALAVGACSLIYNPSNITKPDASHDGPIDAKPGPQDAPETITDANAAALAVTSVDPAQIVEGQGSGGSRMAVLVVHGMNIVSGATISITPANGSDMPMVTSMAGGEVVGADHNFIAVPVKAAVNTICDTGTIPLKVTVTQGSTSATADWQLACLPQINQGSNLSLPTTDVNAYSEFVLTGNAKLTAADSAKPLIVRATADIAIASAIDVSGSGATPGPGAFGGGAAGVAGSGAGGGGPGGGVILAGGGGGGGYHDKGTDGTAGTGGPAQGDPAMTGGYAANFASGGGGGDYSGGGGGGTIELTAGGSLTTNTITSKGGAGGGGITGYAGGGGAGGTIVLRGAVVNAGTLSVAGGVVPNSGGGGAGSPGRMRVDAPSITNSTTAYIGLSFASTAPYITNSANPPITVHGTAGARFDVFTLDQANNVKDVDTDKLLNGTTAQITPAVHWGWNKVCIVPRGGVPGATPESASCVEIAFLP